LLSFLNNETTIHMKLNKTTVYLLLALVVICLPALLHAQGPGFGDDTDDVPIDGGLSLLVAAGVGYGAKKLKDARSKKQTSKEII